MAVGSASLVSASQQGPAHLRHPETHIAALRGKHSFILSLYCKSKVIRLHRRGNPHRRKYMDEDKERKRNVCSAK